MAAQRGVWGQYLPFYIPELQFRYGAHLTRTFSEWRLRVHEASLVSDRRSRRHSHRILGGSHSHQPPKANDQPAAISAAPTRYRSR
jgi:hypothetical protein